jgi:hypothetical protein
MKRGMCVLAMAAVLCGDLAAQADTVSFDANLVAPGYYNGSGNPNGGFTVSTNAGVEVGLRAKLRQGSGVIDSSNNVYVVPSGSQPGSPTHAAWNYDFSINLQGTSPALTLADITAMLTIKDLTTGAPASTPVDVLTYFGDDASYDGTVHQGGIVVGAYGAQNSENPAFGNFPLAASYDENAPDHYLFTLDVNTKAGAHLATDVIEVDAVATPLPSSVWGGLALLGCIGATTGMKRLRRPVIA